MSIQITSLLREIALFVIGLLGHYIVLPHVASSLIIQFVLDIFLYFPVIHLFIEVFVPALVRICYIFSYKYVRKLQFSYLTTESIFSGIAEEYSNGHTFKDIEFPSLSDYPIDLN